MRRVIRIAGVAATCLAVSAGCKGDDKKDTGGDTPGATKPAGNKGKSRGNGKALGPFDADTLVKELAADAKAFKSKYEGKRVTATGVVTNFITSTAGPTIDVKTTARTGEGSVRCNTDTPAPWAEATPRRPATVTGKVMAFEPDVLLHECTIEVTGGTLPPTRTVVDMLALKVKPDDPLKIATDVLEGTVYFVEGTVSALEPDHMRVVLKAPAGAKHKVYVHYGMDMGRAFKKVKVGQHIKAIGIQRIGSKERGIAMAELVSKR